MATKFSDMFKAFARIVDDLESKVSSPDNITNWITQLVGNGDFSHAITISGKILNQIQTIQFPANFQPASSKGNSNAYLESARVGDFGEDNLEDNSLILLAYNVGWLCLGKPLATVNMGRGLILRQLLSDLGCDDLTITIKDVAFGGSQPKRDIQINWSELLQYIEFQVIRSNRITKLQNRSGKLHHEKAATKVKLVKEVKKI